MKRIWFRRKTYGWGWYPVTWQGVLVLGGYVMLLIVLAANLHAVRNAGDVLSGFVFPVIALTILLIVICYYTGEPPRWQWGKPKDNEKDHRNH